MHKEGRVPTFAQLWEHDLQQVAQKIMNKKQARNEAAENRAALPTQVDNK